MPFVQRIVSAGPLSSCRSGRLGSRCASGLRARERLGRGGEAPEAHQRVEHAQQVEVGGAAAGRLHAAMLARHEPIRGN